jgi:8-oxo-dGTP diphosphatase
MNKERAKVGTAVIVRKDGFLLMQKRRGSHGSGTWSVPGGHIEFGESPEECVIRETKEETGVTIGNVRFIGMINDVMAAEGKHYVTLWFEADHVSGEPTVVAPQETESVGWHPIDDMPEPRFVMFENLLNGKLITSRPHVLPFP